MVSNDDDRELIARATSGDEVALERLLLDNCDRLLRHIRMKLPPSVRSVLGVEDVLQETFTQVFRDIGKFEPRSALSFPAWLRTIAEHRMQDAVKALKRKKRGGEHRRVQTPPDTRTSSIIELVEVLSADGPSPSQAVARREAVKAVQVAIAGLSEDYREAIRLRYLDGKSLAETAAQMNRTPDAVRGLVSRAKRKMREVLGRSSRYLSKR